MFKVQVEGYVFIPEQLYDVNFLTFQIKMSHYIMHSIDLLKWNTFFTFKMVDNFFFDFMLMIFKDSIWFTS
jgi:hypothetical protein